MMEYCDFDRVCAVISMSLANRSTNYIKGEGNQICCGDKICAQLTKYYSAEEYHQTFLHLSRQIREFRLVYDLPVLIVHRDFTSLQK